MPTPLYKCTKIRLGTRPTVSSGLISCTAEYVDPTTNPPQPGSISGDISLADSQDPQDLMDAIDGLLDAATLDTMNWTI